MAQREVHAANSCSCLCCCCCRECCWQDHCLSGQIAMTPRRQQQSEQQQHDVDVAAAFEGVAYLPATVCVRANVCVCVQRAQKS